MSSDVLQFSSWGFELSVPPTPFGGPKQPTRFVMLDDLNDVFYDVDYGAPMLGNEVAWTDLALHNVSNPAIVFPPEQQDMLQIMQFATAVIVSIESKDTPVLVARSLGRVQIKPLPREFMNWVALRVMKGPELPAEMRAGLLRRLWNRDPDNTEFVDVPFVTPSKILNGMPRKWHIDGVSLNLELDRIFVGGRMLNPPSRWRISGLGQRQIEISRTRAADLIDG